MLENEAILDVGPRDRRERVSIMTTAIPEIVRSLVTAQIGNVIRADKNRAIDELNRLGIRINSEFYAFFLEFQVSVFASESSHEELSDICEPTPEIWIGTRFVREVWELPEEYVCITSCQGEGCYLYSNRTEAVYDFSLSAREEFLRNPSPQWAGFFEFMQWYLGGVSAE